jgi:hypothetical protein
MNDNYPDDIRQYDNCPGSPFFEDPNEWFEQKSIDLGMDFVEEMVKSDYVEELDWDRADMICMMKAGDYTDQCDMFIAEAYKLIEANPDRYKPEPDYGDE